MRQNLSGKFGCSVLSSQEAHMPSPVELYTQSICTHYSSLSGQPDIVLGSETLNQPTIPRPINVFSFTGITIFLIMKPNLAYGQISCSALYIAAYVPTSLGPFFVSQISILRWIIVRTKIKECIEQEKTRKKIVVTLLILGLMYHAICFSIGIKHGSPLGILQQVNLIPFSI